ncbi:hypothetical protein P0W64_19015 [Tsukamurella sp. 8F]|uniref:hypothetical protein n=1 Tax=unclassified Tsukamurella TaxID=2633480 RepID=UPI0023B9E67C|nr:MULTISPECIES: hypothetical protein [unclassified Tsukamurella]MDF0531977.1 hypothetical protein [Tsukamurella sp. 8J]MDF0588876.1 hypothetical protein [Tsukamurella sp. 8F]
MTGTTAPPAVPSESSSASVRTRGSTSVRDRVRHRLIEHAVSGVHGVRPQSGALPGRALPSVRLAGEPAASDIRIEVAAAWPFDGGELVGDVQAAVAAELWAALGEEPRRIDVRLARVVADRSAAEVAAAYQRRPDAESTPPEPRRAGPKRMAGASTVATLVAIALVAAGVIALRDTLIHLGWIGGAAWCPGVATALGGAHWSWWTWPAAVAVGVIGLALLVLAVAPRRVRAVPVGDAVWVSRDSARAREEMP